MAKITLTINGIPVVAEEGTTILQAAESAGMKIPTLCNHPDLRTEGVCRICVVDIKGQKLLQPACAYPVADGMSIMTHSPRVREARKMIVELLLANHPQDCLTCVRNQKCELQGLAQELGVQDVPFKGERKLQEEDDSSASIVRDPEKCILCKRCIRVCHEIQTVGTLTASGRGWDTEIGPALGMKMVEAVCVNCGQCINRCPTGALREKSSVADVWAAIADPTKHVVVQTAPAVRAAIGEEFGTPGRVTGKMVAGLRAMGFDKIFDTDFTADLTIMEEGYELIHRVTNGGVLPQLTSCSPGWIKFIEHFYPELLPHLSSCKSPQQMFGALAKTYYAEKAGIDPKDIVSVSIMPCTAKKFECDRPEMADSGYQDVDYVLTTREAARMMKEAGIDLPNLPDEEFDLPLGMSTGAAVIFGNTGGVMEAALRTAYAVLTKTELENVNITAVRGMDGVKVAEVPVGDITLKAAIAHGLGNAREVLEGIKSGKFADYHFIEIMCCPGGCIGGGGQPQPTNMDIRKKRTQAIYDEDEAMTIRKSHENPAVQMLYKEFLGEPLGHKSHELLHCKYTPRGTRPTKVEAKCEEKISPS